MSVLDRYIARTYIGGFAILSLVCMGFYTLVDLMPNLDDFTNDPNASAIDSIGYMWDFYRFNWLLYFSQVCGPAMAMAASFTLGMMLRNNEMTALIAAGMPLQRLVAPILVSSLLLVGAWVVNREVVIPRYAEKIARTKDDVVGSRTIGVHCAIDDRNRILTARVFSPRDGRLEWLYIIEPQSLGRPCTLIQADAATFDARRKTWILDRGKRILPGDPAVGEGLGESIREEPIDVYPFGLTPEQLVLRRASQWADYMSLPQLNTLLQSRNLPNRPTIDMSRHMRITQPISQFLLVALALPCFLLRSPGNVIGAAGRALLVCGAFFVAVFVSQTVLPDERLAPLAAWSPILVFGPLAVVRIANVRS